MNRLNLSTDNPATAHALQALEFGDVLTANEYVDMAEAGNELPLPSMDLLTEFFPQTAKLLEDQFRRERFDGLLAATRSRERFGDLEGYRKFSPQQAEEAQQALEAWSTTRRLNRLDEARLRTILTFIGFEPQKIISAASHRFEVQVRAVEDRVQCPVPLFGSAAGGRYRIVASFDRSTVDDLVNGEWRAARELIQTPLRAAGYRFESDDLVTRILSQTNYYPNLIQIYCSFLFRDIQSQPPSGAIQAPYSPSPPGSSTRFIKAARSGTRSGAGWI